MYQSLSSRPRKFFVFHKIFHFYFKWPYEYLCTEQYLTVWVGKILIGYNFMTLWLGVKNVINLQWKMFDYFIVIRRFYLLILKRIFLISEKFSFLDKALFPSEHAVCFSQY